MVLLQLDEARWRGCLREESVEENSASSSPLPFQLLRDITDTKSCHSLPTQVNCASRLYPIAVIMSDVPMYDTAGYQSFVHQLDPRIRPLRCTKEHLEGRKHTIIRFTTQFYKNNEQLGQSITRSVVEFFWIDEIWRLYPTDHPEKRRLIGQVIEQL